MKIIVNGKERILRLLGKQRLQNVQYRMMRFVLQTECSDGILFHNVITGQMVILDYEEANAIKSLPCKPNDTLQLFIESYFLVPVEYDEKDTVVKLRRILNRLFPCSGVSTYTIFTTTNCNARCFYCYESNLERINMSERTADLLVKYIIEHNTGDMYLYNITQKVLKNLNWVEYHAYKINKGSYILILKLDVSSSYQNMINISYAYVDVRYFVQAAALKDCIAGVFGFLCALLSGRLLAFTQAGGNTLFGIPVYAQQVQSALSMLFAVSAIIFAQATLARQKTMLQ